MASQKECFGTSAGIPASVAARAGDYVYTSGQVPLDADGNLVGGDIGAQTKVVMERLKAALASAGCGMEDVVKCTCWLSDVGDFQGFNAVYATYFPDSPPVRSTVRADLMVDCKVEVEAFAYKPL